MCYYVLLYYWSIVITSEETGSVTDTNWLPSTEEQPLQNCMNSMQQKFLVVTKADVKHARYCNASLHVNGHFVLFVFG